MFKSVRTTSSQLDFEATMIVHDVSPCGVTERRVNCFLSLP